jgi:NitT/TauT family transport system ATP-binding protein
MSTTAMTPLLQMFDVHHRYGPLEVLHGIELRLPPARMVALLGPSGCGKTTLLHLAAGLLEPHEGRIERATPPGGAGMALMFQQPRLLPWKTTLANIALPLRAAGLARPRALREAAAMAEAVGLDARALAAWPLQLSGGMQSRAALARALALQPALLLADEPFAALDIGLKAQMHALLLAHAARHGMAVLMITHDPAEAVRLAHEVLVMAAAPGRVVARFEPPGPPAMRGDSQVLAATAAMLALPAVRQAFGLPGMEPSVARAAGADVRSLAEARQALPSSRGQDGACG